MLSWCSDNTQSLVHDNFKSKYLQKLLTCFSGIVTSTFKAGNGDCGGRGSRFGWDRSEFGGSCGVALVAVVFLVYFLLFLFYN